MLFRSWDDATESLEDFDFTKFLRHYLLTTTDQPVQSRSIVKEFRSRIKQLNPNGAQKNLLEIEKAASLYGQILALQPHANLKLAESFKRMNRYSETHRVFLLALLKLDGAIDTPTQERLCRAIEFLSYRWITASKNAQELESIYQSNANSILADQTPENMEKVISSLISNAPDDERFAAALIDNNSPDLKNIFSIGLRSNMAVA